MPDPTDSKPILFLLDHDFEDAAFPGQHFHCRHCLPLEGALASFPGLRERLDVRHVGFARPRHALIAVLGSEDQSLPKLVLPATLQSQYASGHYRQRQYISGSERILAALVELYAIPPPHP